MQALLPMLINILSSQKKGPPQLQGATMTPQQSDNRGGSAIGSAVSGITGGGGWKSLMSGVS